MDIVLKIFIFVSTLAFSAEFAVIFMIGVMQGAILTTPLGGLLIIVTIAAVILGTVMILF